VRPRLSLRRAGTIEVFESSERTILTGISADRGPLASATGETERIATDQQERFASGERELLATDEQILLEADRESSLSASFVPCAQRVVRALCSVSSVLCAMRRPACVQCVVLVRRVVRAVCSVSSVICAMRRPRSVRRVARALCDVWPVLGATRRRCVAHGVVRALRYASSVRCAEFVDLSEHGRDP
jgi:hypothetical protein